MHSALLLIRFDLKIVHKLEGVQILQVIDSFLVKSQHGQPSCYHHHKQEFLHLHLRSILLRFVHLIVRYPQCQYLCCNQLFRSRDWLVASENKEKKVLKYVKTFSCFRYLTYFIFVAKHRDEVPDIS